MKIILCKYDNVTFQDFDFLRSGCSHNGRLITEAETKVLEDTAYLSNKYVVVDIPDGTKYKIFKDRHGLEYIQEVTERIWFAPRVVEA